MNKISANITAKETIKVDVAPKEAVKVNLANEEVVKVNIMAGVTPDADTVDGKHASAFADADHVHADHVHAGEDISSGALDGDRLPALSTTKRGGVPATGTPSGKYLKDDGNWAAPGLDLSSVWPVGSVFLSVIATSPATLLGFGTWSQIAGGKFLVGQTPSDADFDVAEETGGAKTRNLAHTHTNAHTHTFAEDTGNEPNHTHSVNPPNTETTTKSGAAYSGTGGVLLTDAHSHDVNIAAFDSGAGGGHSHSVSGTTGSGGGTTGSGGSAAQNILPPYFVIYVWKRTA